MESGFQLDSIKDALWHKAKTPPNIFCLHTRWNRQSVASLFKQKKPFYFSILRDPVSLFISLWDYYGVSKKLNDVTLQEFAMSSNKPEKLIMPGWVSSNSNGMTQVEPVYCKKNCKKKSHWSKVEWFIRSELTL